MNRRGINLHNFRLVSCRIVFSSIPALLRILFIALCFKLSSLNAFAEDNDASARYFSLFNSNWNNTKTEFWINDLSNVTSIEVGDPIHFLLTSSQPAYFTLFVHGPDDEVTILKPGTMNKKAEGPLMKRFYPRLPDDCKFPVSQSCQRLYDQIVAEEPIGRHTAHLLATEMPIPNFVFDIDEGVDFRDLNDESTLLSTLDKTVKFLSDSRIHYTMGSKSFIVKDSGKSVLTIAAKSLSPSALVQRGDSWGSAPDILNTISELSNSHELAKLGKQYLGTEISESVSFASGSTTIDVKSRDALIRLGQVLSTTNLGEGSAISLVGHADSSGSSEYNYFLSIERAFAVKNYLVQRFGLSESSFQVGGEGDLNPIYKNDTMLGRALNRRVDILVSPETQN